MRIVKTRGADEDFHVIGLGLPLSSRQCLSAAFPRCILYTPSRDEERYEYTRELCDLLGRVVIFSYIPALPGLRWLRTSAVFDENKVRVVGVHPHCTDDIYDFALEAEFAGVIEADAEAVAYQRAAVSVLHAELWFPRGYLSRRTRESLATTSPGGLSDREADILALLASGITNQTIADRLFISRDTVRWHLRSIYAKLGVSDREAAYRLAKNKLAAATHAAGQRSSA